ncbi:MAG: hypothetical protein ACTSWZ_07755 [Candidatus Heimdallarchaeaceae archaeon]
MEKVKNEAEKKLILALYEKGADSVSELHERTGVSRKWIKKLLQKYESQKIVNYNLSSKKKRFTLNKKYVMIKSLSWEILKEYLIPIAIGLFVLLLISGFLFSLFSLYSFLIILGGVIVSISQIVYSIIKLLRTPETKEVWITGTSPRKTGT